ncbi:MAG: helix-turn-helix domain-containing protein [Oscillospiraceae bacterium]|nr:helix-turn-helix domain-containing protein [Oscillospiraceae bacterium]
MKRFIIDGRYVDLLKYYNISLEEVLRKAELPGDVFSHKTPTMTEEQYFRFIETISCFITDPHMPIQIACTDKIESFSPPIFASYCSKNGLVCIERLARYKALIGPMRFLLTKTDDTLTVELTTVEGHLLPQFLAESEIVFLVNLIRKASKEEIVPVSAEMIKPPDGSAFAEYLKTRIIQSERNAITFSLADMSLLFITYDEAMWSYFEPELNKRLAELDIDESTAARVRSALTELLPGGACGIEDVAEKLGLSKRTLQRKLSEENTTFQKQLNSVREMLAKHYIRNTDMTTNDIAFLLGYQEINSFVRAFSLWTGMGISEFRANR